MVNSNINEPAKNIAQVFCYAQVLRVTYNFRYAFNMRTTLIIGPANPSPYLIEQARLAAAQTHLAQRWQVITDDDYGMSFQIAETCSKYYVPFTCYGVTVRPRNSISMKHYQRVVSDAKTYREKRMQRDRFMLLQAHKVICLGRPDILFQAALLNKTIHYVPDEELLTLEYEPEPLPMKVLQLPAKMWNSIPVG